MAPFFSIIVPSLNQARFLERALTSVFAEVDDNDELIVVDGGSTDGSVDIIRSHAKQLAWWVSEPDGGQSAGIYAAIRIVVGWRETWSTSMKATGCFGARAMGSGTIGDSSMRRCGCMGRPPFFIAMPSRRRAVLMSHCATEWTMISG